LLDQLNSKRQKIELEIVQDIENRLLKNPSLLEGRLLYLWDDFWEPSVLGIAASRLCRKYHIPVILLSGSTASNAVGSGRSVNQINIHRALQHNASLLERFGGHAMACGLTVKKENIEPLGKNLARYIEAAYSAKDFEKTITIDAVLDLDEVSFDLANEIDRLRPFGMANPEPVFMCRNIEVVSSYIFAGSHRKMIVKKASSPAGHCIEAFHFNLTAPDNQPDFFSHLIFKLKLSKFKTGSAQIIIEDTDF
jgi:single-stranded-DNA-specific exonuclease